MLQKNINLSNLAPIVLFTYNRPWHTKQTIEALQKNELAKENELFIFSDGGKDESSWEKVNEVREYLKTINGFKKVILTFQDKNIGLADSIIFGVTNIINRYGKIIVLEDDMVTSPYFIKFMNEALDFYENNQKIWQVSGWFFPIENKDLNDIIVHNIMNCWGWGTWKDRWKYFTKNPKNIIQNYTPEEIYKFNLDGCDESLWRQIEYNFKGKINSWAIFWHEIIYKNNGFYINPKKSILKNIGTDGSGIHHGEYNHFGDKIDLKKEFTFDKNLVINNSAIFRIKMFFNEINNKNRNYIYSKQTNKIFDFLDKLSRVNTSFILYGTGTGMDLTLCRLEKNKILFAIDKDENKNHLTKNDIKIISLSNLKNYDNKKTKIIITVFGRGKEIKENLINTYNIDKSRIISLDILDE